MQAWRRWQDWVTMALGVVIFASPFVFAGNAQTLAGWTSYIAGTLIFLGGFWAASLEKPGWQELIPVAVGILLVLSPFLLDYTTVTALAWSAWIVGILAVICAGSLLISQQPTQQT